MIYMYRRPKTFEESFFALSVARSFMFANGVREPFVFACVCVRLQSSAPAPTCGSVRERSRTFANVREHPTHPSDGSRHARPRHASPPFLLQL